MPDRPWMTALEMQFNALNCSRKMLFTAVPNRQQTVADNVDNEVVRYLPSSECYSWSAETTQALWLASRSIPSDATIHSQLLPAPRCFWWFESPLPIRWSDNRENMDNIDNDHVSALMLVSIVEEGVPGLVVVDFRKTPYGLASTGVWATPLGTTVGQIEHGNSVASAESMDRSQPTSTRTRAESRFVVAACAWLQQRIVTMSSGHIERHRRKQIAREYQVPPPADVKVIELRRYETEPRAANPHAEPVEWSCRWIVNRHLRKQPTKDGIKVIEIGPYVKGPADKPLKVPTHTVYMVDR